MTRPSSIADRAIDNTASRLAIGSQFNAVLAFELSNSRLTPRSRRIVLSVLSKSERKCTRKFGSVPDGWVIDLWILHPKPPAPGDATTSIPKDYEFKKVSERIDGERKPTIVCGDLNDVAWSRPTRRFLQRANMLDPRKGRGFITTFPSYAPVLGFPLDQIFVSRHFAIGDFRRLENIGSDHYPLRIEVSEGGGG